MLGRRAAYSASAFGLALAASSFAPNAHAVVPHRSERYVASSNGFASIAYDTQLSKIDLFLEHPYQSPSAGVATR
ncbi:MAG: hypothetical protein ABI332_08925, partial [Polyangiaceae bacterium]